MDEIMIFGDTADQLRVVNRDGALYFCGIDVAKAIGRGKTSTLTRTIPAEHQITVPMQTAKGIRDTIFMDEATMYQTFLTGRSEKAQMFQKWVTEVVLPSIRKNGGYIAGQEHLAEDEIRDLNAIIKGLRQDIVNLNLQKMKLEGQNDRVSTVLASKRRLLERKWVEEDEIEDFRSETRMMHQARRNEQTDDYDGYDVVDGSSDWD